MTTEPKRLKAKQTQKADSAVGMRLPKPAPIKTTGYESISETLLPAVQYNQPKFGRKDKLKLLKENDNLFDYMNRLGVPVAAQPALLAWFHGAAELAIAGKPLPSLEPADAPHRPGTYAEAEAPMPEAARALFGDAPPATRPSMYTRTTFPEEWFNNPAVVRAARHLAKQHGKGGELSPSELDRVRTASRFVKQYQRRQPQARTPGNPMHSLGER